MVSHAEGARGPLLKNKEEEKTSGQKAKSSRCLEPPLLAAWPSEAER